MALTYETYYRRYLDDPLTSNGNNPPTGGTDGSGGTPPIGEIVQGPPGPIGPQGVPGPPGVQGPVGATGPQGVAGIPNVVENQGSVITTRTTINFTGAGVVASDDSVNNRTNVTVSGASAGVSSFNTRTGAVVPAVNDYTAAQVTNAVSTTGSYADPVWITSLSYSKLTSVPAMVNTFNTRSGTVVPATGDYTAAQVTNAVDSTQTYANPTWITSLAYSKLTGVPNFLVNPLTTKGDLITYGTSAARLPVGTTNGMVLTVNSAATNGIDWETPVAAPVSSVFTRTGAVVAQSSDYSTFYPLLSGSYSDPSWITGLSWSKILSPPSVASYQSPWVTAINGAGYTLSGANNITLTGSLGVGTASPSVDLHILRASGYTQVQCENTAGTTDTGYIIKDSNRGYKLGINIGGVTGAGTFSLYDITGGAHRIIVQPNGDVGIGLIGPTYLLQLNADSAAKPSTSAWTISSGGSVKQNVKNLDGGLEIIKKLRPTEAEYNGKGGTSKGARVVSLIAEEVAKILPHTVTKDRKGNLGFNVHEVIFHLILAVQQLSAKVEELESA